MAVPKRKAVHLLTPHFRISWPNVFFPAKELNGEMKYSAEMIFRPADFSDNEKDQWKAMTKELDEISKHAFSLPFAKIKASPNYHTPMNDGAEKKAEYGYGEGTILIRAKSNPQYPPGVVGNIRTEGRWNVLRATKDPETGVVTNPDEIYPGAVCRAKIGFWAFDNKSKGIGTNLISLQFLRHGDRLDGRIDAADDFDEDLPEAEGDNMDF